MDHCPVPKNREERISYALLSKAFPLGESGPVEPVFVVDEPVLRKGYRPTHDHLPVEPLYSYGPIRDRNDGKFWAGVFLFVAFCFFALVGIIATINWWCQP
ncbi:MAG TPA: hypothetical protein VG944_13150 [Fimbriimonas sp.]|nr:hypothetical protein [Fimbriimonas sp.]